MSSSKSGRLSAAQVNAMTKQQLKSYLTSFDQRLPSEERNKEYYKQRVLKFIELHLQDEDSSENEMPAVSRPKPSRGRRASAMMAEKGHGTTVTMSRSRNKPQTPSPMRRRLSGRVISSSAKRRGMGQEGKTEPDVPTPSPSARRGRVRQVPTSGGRKKTPDSLSRSLKRKRNRMRHNTADPDFLQRLAHEVEEEDAAMAKQAREAERNKEAVARFEIDGPPARHTVTQLKKWLVKHGIEFDRSGQRKQYYVDLVSAHSLVASPKRPLSPLSKHNNTSPNKKLRANGDSPRGVGDKPAMPVPPNLDPEALTPQKPSSPPQRERRHQVEGSQSPSPSPPAASSGHATQGGNLLTTPLLIKKGVSKVSKSAERRMRSEIRHWLDDEDEDDDVVTYGMTSGQAEHKDHNKSREEPKEPYHSVAAAVSSSLAGAFSPQGVWNRVGNHLLGSEKKKDVDVDASPEPVYSVPIRSQAVLPVDSPLRHPPKRVLVEEERRTPASVDEGVNEDEVETDYEDSPPPSSDRGFLSGLLKDSHHSSHAVEDSNSPFPQQRLVFPSSRPAAGKVRRKTPPSHAPAIPEQEVPAHQVRARRDVRQGQEKTHPTGPSSKPPPRIMGQASRYAGRREAEEAQKPMFLSPEKPPYSVSPSLATEANKRSNPLRSSAVALVTLLVLLLAAGIGMYLHDSSLTAQKRFLRSLVDRARQLAALNVGSDSPLFCDPYLKSIAGRRDEKGDPILCEPCPENAQTCVNGVAKCRKGYILQGDACVVDQEIVRLGHEISHQVAVILADRKGKHQCGWDVEPDVSEAELLSTVQLSLPSQLTNAFSYFKANIVPGSQRISYDADTQRFGYASSHAAKPLRCQLQEWVWQNLLAVTSGLFGVVLLCYLGVTLWISRNDKRQAQLLHKMAYHVLEEQQKFTPAVPFLSLDHMRQRLGKPADRVWARLQFLVETDPNVQKSMRMVDGVQKPCWKLSQTPMMERRQGRVPQGAARWAQQGGTRQAQHPQGQHPQEPAVQFPSENTQANSKHSIYSPARSFGITPAIRRYFSRRPRPEDKTQEQLRQSQVEDPRMPAHSGAKYNPWG